MTEPAETEEEEEILEEPLDVETVEEAVMAIGLVQQKNAANWVRVGQYLKFVRNIYPAKDKKNRQASNRKAWQDFLAAPEVRMSEGKASRLITISESKLIRRQLHHGIQLSGDWTTLYKMAAEAEESDEAEKRLEEAFKDGTLDQSSKPKEIELVARFDPDHKPEPAPAATTGISKFTAYISHYKEATDKEDGYEKEFEKLTEADKESLRNLNLKFDLLWLPVIRKMAVDEHQRRMETEKAVQAALPEGGDGETGASE